MTDLYSRLINKRSGLTPSRKSKRLRDKANKRQRAEHLRRTAELKAEREAKERA